MKAWKRRRERTKEKEKWRTAKFMINRRMVKSTKKVQPDFPKFKGKSLQTDEQMSLGKVRQRV